MLRFLRIVHPRNTKLPFPRRKSTNRVFAGCSLSPSRFITHPSRRSASLAADSLRRSPPLHDGCAPASMLPTERHSCRSGRTAHGSVVSYSAWHTHIAGAGVLVLFLWGCWPSPACPRTYLLTSSIKARPLPSSAFCCTPSSVLRTSRTPSRLRSLSAVQPYTFGLRLTRLPGRVSPVPHCSFPACRRPLPRGGPSSIPVQDDVCCLRRDMSGSALPNTFRLIICRGCSVVGSGNGADGT